MGYIIISDDINLLPDVLQLILFVTIPTDTTSLLLTGFIWIFISDGDIFVLSPRNSSVEIFWLWNNHKDLLCFLCGLNSSILEWDPSRVTYWEPLFNFLLRRTCFTSDRSACCCVVRIVGEGVGIFMILEIGCWLVAGRMGEMWPTGETLCYSHQLKQIYWDNGPVTYRHTRIITILS